MKIIYKKGIRNGYAKVVEGSIVLTIPFSARNDENFLVSMQILGEKLQQKIEKKEKNQIFSPEGVLLFGELVPYNELPPLKIQKERENFFYQELFAYANPILQSYAKKLGYSNISLSLRKVHSKRGSCTYDNRIMLNLSLVHLPTRLIQYVIIHEACHLIEKNHSPRFWARVEEFCPMFKVLRKELKNQIFFPY
ncbi:MAG: hypothetical protein DLD55_01430 [candidate division SR1 bacterium]|nr:MAG: hypothetical protein DLD55_01430 [candidate division SR1 bacterium]